MSWYTAGEILVWLLLAAILGFILGWLIRSLLCHRAHGHLIADGQTVRASGVANANVTADPSAHIAAGGVGTVSAAGLAAAAHGLHADVDAPKVDVDAKLPSASLDAHLPKADVDAHLPKMDADAKLPGIGIDGKLPSASVDASLPKVGLDATLPKAEVDAKLPGIDGALPQAGVTGAATGATAATAAAARTTRVAATEARDMVAHIATRTAGAGENPKDDLREVYGIGEVISKMLNEMGITSFRQIARFTPADVATIEDALEFFPDRIVRDDWMSSARELHITKYGFDPCTDLE